MLIFVFLDGIGLGPDEPTNPFSTTDLPGFQQLVGGRMLKGVEVDLPEHQVRAIDAGLGISGLPQSATGQTALFTGVNAPQLEGMHISAFPTQVLRDAIAQHSVLKRAQESGFKVTFANAYSPKYWDSIYQRRNRHSATTWTTMAAGLRFRDFDDLNRGEAVYWDITHEIARASHAPELPYVEASEAGRRLAALTTDHDFVLYENFLPDLTGHRRLDWTPAEALHRIDDMLIGLLSNLPEQATLLITSDHGNLEDTSTRGHTYNAVPLIVKGPGAHHFSDIRDLTGITPAILDYLQSSRAISPN